MKKTLSILLALITLLCAAAPALAAPTEEEAMTDARIYYLGESISYLLYGGDPKGVTPAYYTGRLITGESFEFPAYCVNPQKPGPSEAGPYSVDTKDYITDPKIWGIVSNGYPYKTIGELGVHTREQAFYATKMALWTYINNWNISSWTAASGEQEVTLTALKKIYTAGIAVTAIEQSMLAVSPDKPKMELDALNPNYASQTYTVTANMEIRSFEVFLEGDIPDGTKVTDLLGNPKTVFAADERFKVIVPANQIADRTGNFVVTVKGQLRTNAVIYGLSYDSALQDFAVTRDPFNFQNATTTALYAPQNTFLEIVKLVAGTNSPLAGAVFKVTDSEGGVIGVFTTDGNGRVIVPLTKAGAFQIEELTPPSGFVLDATSHKDVIVIWEQTATVTFTNEKEPSLSVRKIDADTGTGVENAVIRIAKEGGMTFTDVTTGAGGWVYLSLPPGVYSATELFVPGPYALDPTPQTIILEAGKSASIILKNSKKPGLIVWKYDEDTGLPLAGAEFSIAKKGGSIVYEGITGPNGMIHIEDLDPNQWFTVTELASPKGYLKTWESKDVYLEPGKTTEIKFDNRLRPALRLIKVDSQTGAPLAGAKFKVQKTEDVTVSEYVTDAGGTVTIHDLDESVYSVWEYEAPDGFLLDPQHKDIKLEWGKTKTLVFTNKAKPKLRILKIDAVTGEPLPNAEFRVTKAEDATVSEYITDSSGEILIENLDESVYRAEEFMPPDGWLLYTESKEILLEWGKTKTLKFDNIRKPVAIFLKTNALTGKGIPGATFKVEYEQPGGGLKNLGSYKTGTDGRIIIPKAEPGWFVFTETLPAPGFSFPKNPVTRVYFSAGDNAYLSEFEHYYTGTAGAAQEQAEVAQSMPDSDNAFAPALVSAQAVEHSGNEYYTEGEGFNWPLNSIVLKKTHAITGELLPGAVFELYRADEQVSGVPGTAIGRYTTDNSGVIVITGLEPGFFVCKEVQAPANFLISENSQQNGFLKADGTTVLEFSFANYPYGSLLITKADALTGEPLAGARFKVVDGTGAVIGNTNGEYVTDNRGEILISNIKPGAAVVTESQAPVNYAIDTTPQTVQIGTDGKTYKVSFEDYPYGTIVIRKMDYASRKPLDGVEFKVTTSDGSVVGTGDGVFTTDAQGIITIPNLPKNSYIITETKTLPTHILENQTRTVAVDYGQTYTIDFYNKAKSGAQIIKIDAASKQPLKGAKFTVYRQNGEIIGHYETDGDGVIILDRLSPGWFKAVETKAPDGWLLDDTPQDFEVTDNQFIKLVFENKQLSSLQIRKVSETDGTPLAGAVFEVRKQNGEYVGEYTTEAGGAISIPNAAPGWFVISEKKAPVGFILDTAAKTVEVKPIVPTVVTFTNKPLSGLQILKLDEESRRPIPETEFTVAKMNGEVIGTGYRTDEQGLIRIPGLAAGWFTVTETKSAKDYLLDAAPRNIELKDGQTALLTVTNRKASSILLHKIDSLTGKGIYGVKFLISDANSNPLMTLESDQNGYVYLPGIPDGKYFLRELEAGNGYILDTEVKTFYIRYGATNEITWKNTPVMGQIQITKKSADDNPINGFPADTLLEGAVFEIYDRANNLMDTVKSDKNGLAISKPLPLGRYVIREIQAPAYYAAVKDAIDAEIEFSGQIIRLTVLNTSTYTNVSVTKRGYTEVVPGQSIKYDFKNIANNSTVSLDSFYWRDTLPTDAVRLDKLITGTWSARLSYKIVYKTNLGGGNYRTLADNLSTDKSRTIAVGAAALGLASNEYVTELMFLFGRVPAGFRQVDAPVVYCGVLPGLAHEYRFANKTDVGGLWGDRWIMANDRWVTVVYNKTTPPALPRTGY
jgi:uncharacterized surface anchored protein